ncbi:glycoside hydrolase family 65 protein [Arcticibacter eurypsychrophilus]|uniref:glycoside hydrolase family 65 protein n=1 Tax=Arcticibacter eurypsychrophilus TaxID=1434752 RepID=UPI00084D43A5|nr:glycoside hydrolase family 65 protein [Arcticibacter eurypsychrophilus]
MKNYIVEDEWNIIESGFDPHLNKISESIFSIGNGLMGQRANFEESYSGDTLQGNYVAGIYYPDKTRVGWWKNGYPEYFAKVLNAANWIGIGIKIGETILDLNKCEIIDFKRVLNMKEGYLERSFVISLEGNRQVSVVAKRFCSIVDDETGAISYAITLLNFDDELTITPFIDGDVQNQDANYDEKFWDELYHEVHDQSAFLGLCTKKTNFEVCTGMQFDIQTEKGQAIPVSRKITKEKYVANEVKIRVQKEEKLTIYKYAANLSSENYPKELLLATCHTMLQEVADKGFDKMLAEQAAAWAKKWEESDIVIEGDVAAQQAIRFNIFQLNQTYTGEDARLNIGPKGFTGEKYGGSTYWDTEAYCVPFYLATASPEITKNLLIYRYKHLAKAIENAEKLGFNNGAALYPMVTMNGEECHNEWEITFEEIHRNGAIAFAIYNYIRYTGDKDYLITYGLEVLVAISRFWSQRVNWSADKKQYVMLGVTGPNEYENNVNNNWYTSTIATWCMKYTLESLDYVRIQSPESFMELTERIRFDEFKETTEWKSIIQNMYYPKDDNLGIFLQQDGYLDKEQVLVKDLNLSDRPINQKWSWDRILRSVFIKQADVLQGIYLLEDQFDEDTIRRNFDFYEPRTVHESSLSPCVHAILAAKLGDEQRAYDFYLQTSRLDLDDYNNDTDDGLHITSMAGTWMSVVEGFAGMRIKDDQLYFHPFLPVRWQSFSFNIIFRGSVLNVKIGHDGVHLENKSVTPLTVCIFDKAFEVNQYANLYVANSDSKSEIQI